jgi:hypothetical protein
MKKGAKYSRAVPGSRGYKFLFPVYSNIRQNPATIADIF